MHRIIPCVAVLALVASSPSPLLCQAAPTTAADIRYYCEDIPPSNYLEGGELKGVSVETLKLIWKRMGVREQPIRVVPWARGYEIALNERNTVLFSMSRTSEREALFKWVGPIFTVRSVLLGLAGRDIELRGIEDARKYNIGVVKDDVMEAFLKAKGFGGEMLQSISDLDRNFEKLELGRIDLIAHSQDTFEKAIAMRGSDLKRYKVYLVVSSNPNFYAFNRDTPEVLVADFQRAFDAASTERTAILARFGVSQ